MESTTPDTTLIQAEIDSNLTHHLRGVARFERSQALLLQLKEAAQNGTDLEFVQALLEEQRGLFPTYTSRQERPASEAKRERERLLHSVLHSIGDLLDRPWLKDLPSRGYYARMLQAIQAEVARRQAAAQT